MSQSKGCRQEHFRNAQWSNTAMIGNQSVSTDPAAHIQDIEELFQSGATIVNPHSRQPAQPRLIEFYDRQVLPKVASALKDIPAVA
jgi:hypothetical protein